MELFKILLDFIGEISWAISAFSMLYFAFCALRKGYTLADVVQPSSALAALLEA